MGEGDLAQSIGVKSPSLQNIVSTRWASSSLYGVQAFQSYYEIPFTITQRDLVHILAFFVCAYKELYGHNIPVAKRDVT